MRAVALLSLASFAVFAQTAPDVLLRHSFERDTAGWTAMGEGAGVGITNDAARVRPGHSALEFNYELGTKRSALVLGLPPSFARMQRLDFRVRADHSTAIGVLLSEKKPDGGNYSAWFWAPANTWQAVELTPSDFTLNDGPQDPPDPDGKLDLDQVQGIAFFDLGQFFPQLPMAQNHSIQIEAASGAHSLWIDSFEISASAPAPTAAGNASIDPPGREFSQWVSPGVMDIQLSAAENPLHARTLRTSYKQTDGQFELLIRRVAASQVAKAKRLVFDVASEREATLVVAIEMWKPGGGTGPRFTTQVYPPGGREVFHADLRLDQFDGEGHFDPARWRTIAILDITGGSGESNTLWIGNVQVVE